ncbi:hypothetical protein PFICI_14197 [Pestalotiopsis fici W106-1]|uniref:Uncharacterized protein n=1 Tax=Pestalotiopsis fici (strain W106-1 / CGMCC3.15140) TaxID=1229662 RepID=W3WNE2_PESFW|nr:uncharacterized protein PFICI_14197 [Pestalotiopsis fici W106-1]ETS74331.1 hypothetical protein PFICI_14197 [Pestalotiopsis fici W106-1]
MTENHNTNCSKPPSKVMAAVLEGTLPLKYVTNSAEDGALNKAASIELKRFLKRAPPMHNSRAFIEENLAQFSLSNSTLGPEISVKKENKKFGITAVVELGRGHLPMAGEHKSNIPPHPPQAEAHHAVQEPTPALPVALEAMPPESLFGVLPTTAPDDVDDTSGSASPASSSSSGESGTWPDEAYQNSSSGPFNGHMGPANGECIPTFNSADLS